MPTRGRFDRIPGMPPKRAHELILLDTEPGHFAAHGWTNILFLRWWQGGTGATLERVGRVRERMADQHPEGVSVVYLVAMGMVGLTVASRRFDRLLLS